MWNSVECTLSYMMLHDTMQIYGILVTIVVLFGQETTKTKQEQTKKSKAKKNKKLRSREDKSRKSKRKPQKSQKQQKPKGPHKSQKPRSQTRLESKKDGPPIFQLQQSTERTLHSSHKTSLQGHLDLSSIYWMAPPIQQHWPLASPPAQLQLWVPPFRPVPARSISCVWFDDMSLKQWFGFWNALRHIFLCGRRQCAKDCKRGFLGFLPKKESENPLATQITASVLPCFWLLQ